MSSVFVSGTSAYSSTSNGARTKTLCNVESFQQIKWKLFECFNSLSWLQISCWIAFDHVEEVSNKMFARIKFNVTRENKVSR